MDARIDAALERALEPLEAGPPRLTEALRYALFPGGGRVRPRLCLAVAEACGGAGPLALGLAGAIELLHGASLAHDDLPCFDDADERRGKPSLHRAFDEATAVLAGDALIVLAFETLADAGAEEPARLARLVKLLARAAGSPAGLVAGQAWEAEPSVPLATYHGAKTGALFVAATAGAAIASGRDPAPWRPVGALIGQAYQVADDLCDAHATAAAAGKPTGQDEALARPNAVSRLGTDGALRRLRELARDAAAAIPPCEGREALGALVVALAERLVPASLQQSAA